LGGLLISPLVVTGAERFAGGIGINALSLPWFFLPLLILVGMSLIGFIHPDPKEIGQNLQRYYEGYVPPPRPSTTDASTFHAMTLLRHRPTLLAIVANSASQGNMSIVMVLTSLVLAHHAMASAPLPPRTCFTRRECSPSRFHWESSPIASATAG